MCVLNLTQIYLDGQVGITPNGEWSTLSCPNCPDENRPTLQNPQAIDVSTGELETNNLLPGCYEMSYITDPVNVCECTDCEVYEMEILPGVEADPNATLEYGCIDPINCVSPVWLHIYRYLNCGTIEALRDGAVCTTNPIFTFERAGVAGADVPVTFGLGANQVRFSPQLLGSIQLNSIDFGANFQRCDGGAVVTFESELSAQPASARGSVYWNPDRSQFNICLYAKENPGVSQVQFFFTLRTARDQGAPNCDDCEAIHILTVNWDTPPVVPAGDNQEICVNS